MLTFDDIREKGLLLFEYIRGSQSYGLATASSDQDTGGIYILPTDCVWGLKNFYQSEIASERQDDKWFEVGKFMGLLLTSNPTVLESLFIPDDCVLYEHPLWKAFRGKRERFLTKKCFGSFGGYAVEQIKKAQGYKKKIVSPVNERLGPLDFCYTFHGQGSTKIKNWLSNRGLFQKYCGLVRIPNMHDTYGVYYDWGQHFQEESLKSFGDLPGNLWKYLTEEVLGDQEKPTEWFEKHQEVIGYRGMIFEMNPLNDLHLSSIPKGHKAITQITYNHSGYNAHCIDYKNYQDWEKNRNQTRFDTNKGYNFDSKNMMHSFRLIRMCTELAKGEGFNLRRTTDREFLLDIKNHKLSYEELMKRLEVEKKEMDDAILKSTLPDEPSLQEIQEELVSLRRSFYDKDNR